MASRKTKRKKAAAEADSVYVLKLVLYLILGSQWLRIDSLPDWSVPLPIGLGIGIWFAMHDHFAIDRKVEYAVLLVAAFVAFWLPLGLVIQL